MTDAEFEAGKSNVQTGLNAGYKLGYDKGFEDAKAKYEPKQGEWIDRNGNTLYPFYERYECSICHEHSDNSNFCPNCGARMKEGDEK